MTEWTPKLTLGLPNGESARTTITNAKEMPAEHRECPKQGNLVLFCPSIGLPSLPGAAPAFLSLIAWLECLRDDAWQRLSPRCMTPFRALQGAAERGFH